MSVPAAASASSTLNPRVTMVIISDLLLPFYFEREQVYYPTTITPELKKEFPLGVAKMEKEDREHFNRWINAAIAQMDPSVTDTIIVGCDNKFNCDCSVSFYIKLSK